MLGLVGSVLGVLRLGSGAGRDRCAVCDRELRSEDDRVPLPRGGHVHRGCATYRMRQHDRTMRRLRSY
jgi:hypothetical protein